MDLRNSWTSDDRNAESKSFTGASYQSTLPLVLLFALIPIRLSHYASKIHENI
jgi:hypothetical protein